MIDWICRNASDCQYFMQKKLDAQRNIYIPSNSTTQTTFGFYVSSCGYSVIGE